MASQPNIGGVWQATIDNMVVHDPGMASTLIVDGNQPFGVSARVMGSGVFWGWAEALGVSFTVEYYAERFGGPPEGVDLGTANVTMSPGGTYDDPNTTLTVPAGTVQPGVYRIMCMARWHTGITAFPDAAAELLIEVY